VKQLHYGRTKRADDVKTCRLRRVKNDRSSASGRNRYRDSPLRGVPCWERRNWGEQRWRGGQSHPLRCQQQNLLRPL